MARPLKRGLDYFPLDTNVLCERRIQRLMRGHGSESVLVYLALLMDIYSEHGYYIEVSDNLYFDIAFVLNTTEEKVKTAIMFCLEVGLFDREQYKKNKIFTSTGIQRRYFVIVRRTKRMYNVNYLTEEYCIEHSIERPDPSVEEDDPESGGDEPVTETKVCAAKTPTKKRESKTKIKQKIKEKENVNLNENKNKSERKRKTKENRIEENGIEEKESASEKKEEGILLEDLKKGMRGTQKARTSRKKNKDTEENEREQLRQDQMRELLAKYPEYLR